MLARRRLPLIRSLAALAVAAIGLSVAPAAQAASSITSIAVTNGDLVVDKTATIAVTGFSDPADSDRRLVIHVNSPSLGCAATEELNAERRVAVTGSEYVPKGAFTDVVLQWTPSTPGPFVFCAWLHDSFPDATFAAASIPVAVRQPLTSLSLSLPGARFLPGATVPLAVVASAEVAREYAVEVNAAGVPCAPNQGANADVTTWLNRRDVLGSPIAASFNVNMPNDGNYHLCGYVGTSNSDTAPTTVIDGPAFTVGPPPRCKVGKSPKTKKKKVSISCTGVTGSVTVSGKRGSRTFTATVSLSAAGKGSVKGTKIGLKKNKRVTVKVIVDGKTVGSRVLRVKK